MSSAGRSECFSPSSPTKEWISDRFVSFFKAREYRLQPAAHLVTSDPTLLFINSSMAPFKDAMLQKVKMEPHAIVQPCFRARESEHYLYDFTMLGLNSEKQYLPKLFCDFFLFLQDLGFSAETLYIVLHKEDLDLQAVARELSPSERITFADVDNPKYKVRWDFGQKTLRGRGLTISAQIAPGSSDVMASHHIPLGNVILVKNGDAEYVDVGFGVECIQSCWHQGDIFQIPFYNQALQTLSANSKHPKELLKHLLAFGLLRAAGVTSSAQKQGSILKKSIRNICNILMKDQLLEKPGLWDLLAPLVQDKTGDLKTQCESFLISESEGKAKAERFLQKTHDIREQTYKKIANTYGLTEFSIRQLQEKYPIISATQGDLMSSATTSYHATTYRPRPEEDCKTPEGSLQETRTVVERLDLTDPSVAVRFGQTPILAQDIANQFLRFFSDREHLAIKGASIIPNNDPTLFYINSGMAPLKDFFLGTQTPPLPRLCNVQKCIRTNDIDDIGDRHHLSMFHMLGSWSIGDYYKETAVKLAFDLLINVFHFPKDKIYATVFSGDKDLGLEADEESAKVWRAVGLADDHIVYLPKEDNLWGPAGEVGPCGPCTEVFYDTGDAFDTPYVPGKPETFNTKTRYIEIWNAGVFMQIFKHKDGTFTPLDLKSVDTGSGLERMTMTMNGCDTVYETDLLKPILDEVAQFFQGTSAKVETHRMVTDHIRTACYILSEGVTPGNATRDYIPRKLIRKCVVAAELAGIPAAKLEGLLDAALAHLSQKDELIATQQTKIKAVFLQELRQFDKILTAGKKRIAELAQGGQLSGKSVFELVTARGLPLDMLELYLKGANLTFDKAEFLQCMEQHKASSRGNLKADPRAEEQALLAVLQDIKPSEFIGYDTLTSKSVIQVLLVDGKPVSQVSAGDKFRFVTETTSFYPEGGGQVGDIGTANGGSATLQITNTQKVGSWILHEATLSSGTFKTGDDILLDVDPVAREGARRNHSATHLLHAAVRSVLGSNAQQRGSLVTPSRLRFDFTHEGALTDAQKGDIQKFVNSQIEADLPVSTQVVDRSSSAAAAATSLFGEKYADKVRVVSMGNISSELCGGTHVSKTHEIGKFLLISDVNGGKGSRRIEAITGPLAEQQLLAHRDLVVSGASSAAQAAAAGADNSLKIVGKGQLRIDGVDIAVEIAKGSRKAIAKRLEQGSGTLAIVSDTGSVALKTSDPAIDAAALLSKLLAPFNGSSHGSTNAARGTISSNADLSEFLKSFAA